MIGFDLHRTLNQFCDNILERRAEEGGAVEFAQLLCMILQNAENLRVADEPGFRDFAQAFDEDIVGQGLQGSHICEHSRRRVERTDEILALRRVDTGFPAG